MDPYRLAPLRGARGRDERVKRGDLASAVGEARVTAEDVSAAAERVAAARAALEAAVAARGALGASAAAPALLALAERFTGRRRRELEAALDAHARARAAHAGRLAEVGAARERLAVARAEREVIERHFERWRADQRRRAERRDE